jgi:Mg-chelatase subunit ChlD
MPDTGAPWNLPYPAPTDLVRDGAQNFEDLADAVALGRQAGKGIGSNVVRPSLTNAVHDEQFRLRRPDRMAATITPSSTSSKILVIFDIDVSNSTRTRSRRICNWYEDPQRFTSRR